MTAVFAPGDQVWLAGEAARVPLAERMVGVVTAADRGLDGPTGNLRALDSGEIAVRWNEHPVPSAEYADGLVHIPHDSITHP